jgi:hypothetical protein
MKLTRSTLAATFGLLALTLTGCGTTTLSAKDVGARVNDSLMKDNPTIAKGSMDCPSLTMKQGNTIRCTRAVTGNGITATIGVTVTVTSVHGSSYGFSTKVDDQARSIVASGDQVASDLEAKLSARGVNADQVTCPDLSGVVGKSVTCDVDAGGSLHTVRAAVTSVDLGTAQMNYSFTVTQ